MGKHILDTKYKQPVPAVVAKIPPASSLAVYISRNYLQLAVFHCGLHLLDLRQSALLTVALAMLPYSSSAENNIKILNPSVKRICNAILTN